jgi:hypothetical protein
VSTYELFGALCYLTNVKQSTKEAKKEPSEPPKSQKRKLEEGDDKPSRKKSKKQQFKSGVGFRTVAHTCSY